jgi:hypothetical protein
VPERHHSCWRGSELQRQSLRAGPAAAGESLPETGDGPPGTASRRRVLFLLIAVSATFAVFFSVYAISRHNAFHSYTFDMGWQNQAFYSLLRLGYPRVTVWVPLNHLGNHFQPLYYLLVMQAVALASAAIPIYLIGVRRLINPWAGTDPTLRLSSGTG